MAVENKMSIRNSSVDNFGPFIKQKFYAMLKMNHTDASVSSPTRSHWVTWGSDRIIQELFKAGCVQRVGRMRITLRLVATWAIIPPRSTEMRERSHCYSPPRAAVWRGPPSRTCGLQCSKEGKAEEVLLPLVVCGETYALQTQKHLPGGRNSPPFPGPRRQDELIRGVLMNEREVPGEL